MHGVKCINIRICGAVELARIALMRSGITIKEEFVSAREEVPIIAEAVTDEKYFCQENEPKYSDLRNIANAVRRMRSLVSDENEGESIAKALGQSIFEEKNAALKSVYEKFKKHIDDNKRMDSISLIRKAIAMCGPMEADFCYLEEYPLSPLEKALLDKLSNGRAKASSLRELFEAEEKKPNVESYKECYGAPNEVESILADIYAKKELDKCVVAVTEPTTYGQLFFDYALLYDMPISFGCGIPIVNSNPAKLLVLYYRWMTSGLFGVSAIKNMLSSQAFNRGELKKTFSPEEKEFSWNKIYKYLGQIRLTNDGATNKIRIENYEQGLKEDAGRIDKQSKDYDKVQEKLQYVPYLTAIAEELAQPAEEFIKKYGRIRFAPKAEESNAYRLLMALDLAAAKTIYDELKLIKSYGEGQATEDMILNILKKTVASGKSEAGKLHVTTIAGALSTVRDNLYVAGLSAPKYPGSPKENYLLLDDDIKAFGEEAEYLTSAGQINKKRMQLLSLVNLVASLNANVSISFPGLDVSELKQENESSLIFELVKNREPEKVKYFEPAISATRKIGEAYNAGKNVLTEDNTSEVGSEEQGEKTVQCSINREFSPSALDDFFSCPRKFMLKWLLKLQEPEEDKPFEILAAKEQGTIAHSLMERLANSAMPREEFLQLANECFDSFIMQHPALIEQDVSGVKTQFLEMMGTAYNMEPEPRREVVLKEEKITCTHDTGIILQGLPDRVEKTEDGLYVIVDYKTGYYLKHIENDINTCLQVILYAYMWEKEHCKVIGGEYRYIKLGTTVTCSYDEIKEKLSEKLSEFKNVMEKGQFPISVNADYKKNSPCTYCKFGLVCGKDTEIGGLGDD